MRHNQKKEEGKLTKEIKIYTTPTCPYCTMAKKFLAEKDVSYKEVDVTSDHEGRQKMIKLSRQLGVPVIIIDNKIVIGFDQPRLEKLLGKKIG